MNADPSPIEYLLSPPPECQHITHIENRLKELLGYMQHIHSNVLAIRLDVKFPSSFTPPPDNALFSRFLNSFIVHLRRKGSDPHYLWVREWNRDSGYTVNHHYNCILLLDGQVFSSPHAIFKKAEELWGSALGGINAQGLIEYCSRDGFGNPQPNGLVLRRDKHGDPLMEQACLDWGRYLAKSSTKGHAPHGVREWGSSRIPIV